MFKKSLLQIVLALTVTRGYSQTVAYVTNDKSHTVSVIDTASNAVTATIPVGKNPSGVVFSPDGSRAYVMNTGENTISIINTATAAVTATFSLGGKSQLGPELIALTPNGKKLYVALESGSVLVVDTATNSVSKTIPVPSAGAVVISRDGSRAYVQTVLSDGVFVIDTAKDTVIAQIPVKSHFSVGIAESPDGRKIYAAGGVHVSQISIIDRTSNTVTATIPCKGGPQGIAIIPDGSKAYVANELTDSVNIVDLKTNTVEPLAIPVGKNPALVALTPDGKLLYVTNFQLGQPTPEPSTVSVINTATNKVIATVPVGQIPAAIAVGRLTSPVAKAGHRKP